MERSGGEHSPSPWHNARVMRVMVMLLPPRSGGHCDHCRGCRADNRTWVRRGLREEGGGAPEEEEEEDGNDDDGGCLDIVASNEFFHRPHGEEQQQ